MREKPGPFLAIHRMLCLFRTVTPRARRSPDTAEIRQTEKMSVNLKTAENIPQIPKEISQKSFPCAGKPGAIPKKA